jgi:DNA-binding MltR family transcriptional regulator
MAGNRKLSRSERTETLIDDLNPLMEALVDKSDTICAILVASYIDGALFALLAEHFISGSSTVKSLMGENGPLGSLKSRGDLAYCLGMISDGARENIELVGKIRNKFAHRLRMTFATREVSHLCDRLTIPTHQFVFVSQDPVVQQQLKEGTSTPRGKYMAVGRTLAMSLLVAASNEKHRIVNAYDPWSPTYKSPGA